MVAEAPTRLIRKTLKKAHGKIPRVPATERRARIFPCAFFKVWQHFLIMAIIIKTKEEIAVMRECGRRLAAILRELTEAAKPGVTAADLDRFAEERIISSGGIPVFKGYRTRDDKRPYPGSICISVNDEVVHGVPAREKILKEGDVVGIDIGMRWGRRQETPHHPDSSGGTGQARDRRHVRDGGLVTDMAVTVGIGKISEEAHRLIRVTQEALEIGISVVKIGAHVGDIGHAVAKHLRKHNLGIVRDLAGHGVGRELHEEPLIPNYGSRGSGAELKEGMAIAIEPMAMLGGEKLILDDDQWTYRTADNSLAAHFEHSVAVTKEGAEVLTQMP